MEAKSEIPTLDVFRTRKGSYPRLTRIATTSTQDLRAVQEQARELRTENFPGKPLSRRALGKHVRRQRRRDIAELPVPVIDDDRFRLEVCDFRELAVGPDSLDLIFTDIPYSRDFGPSWEPLAEFASRGLKEGGHFLCMTGQDCLPGIMEASGKHLEWVWLLALVYGRESQAMVHHKKIRTGWKPILWYTKGKNERRDEIIDNFICTRSEKEYGEWQQGVEDVLGYLRLLSEPGDLICDPCLGHGTTAVACMRLGDRRFVGCDILPDRVADARRRLAKEEVARSESQQASA